MNSTRVQQSVKVQGDTNSGYFRKINQGSVFYSVVTDPMNFATTNKLLYNNIMAA